MQPRQRRGAIIVHQIKYDPERYILATQKYMQGNKEFSATRYCLSILVTGTANVFTESIR